LQLNIQNIMKRSDNLGRDKKLHFLVGALIALIGGVVISPLTGFILASIAGVVKDVGYDLILDKGCFEVLDIVYTVLGGLLIYIILI